MDPPLLHYPVNARFEWCRQAHVKRRAVVAKDAVTAATHEEDVAAHSRRVLRMVDGHIVGDERQAARAGDGHPRPLSTVA